MATQRLDAVKQRKLESVWTPATLASHSLNALPVDGLRGQRLYVQKRAVKVKQSRMTGPLASHGCNAAASHQTATPPGYETARNSRFRRRGGKRCHVPSPERNARLRGVRLCTRHVTAAATLRCAASIRRQGL